VTPPGPEMSGDRFVSRGERWGDFGDETLVVCPRCGGGAVTRCAPRPEGAVASERLSCGNCGYAHELTGRAFPRGREPYAREGIRLWLETPCCGDTLAARNATHLEYLEGFVRAGLRERVPDAESGWSNRALVSRLPKWMQAAGNRDEVLRCIERLKRRLA
jgi:predicted RNA-binding Zn-ribbon protein involved in translation (DUF1610 family)